jgi:endonuclease/exonuclease/phosphatase family metal-dependent hydrolase
LLAALPADPAAVLLMGDVNAVLPWGRALKWLRHYFGPAPSARSFPGRWPLLPLDCIWVRQPGGRVRRLWAHRTPLARLASDYVPVCAEVSVMDVAPVVSYDS